MGILRAWNVRGDEGLVRAVREAVVRSPVCAGSGTELDEGEPGEEPGTG